MWSDQVKLAVTSEVTASIDLQDSNVSTKICTGIVKFLFSVDSGHVCNLNSLNVHNI